MIFIPEEVLNDVDHWVYRNYKCKNNDASRICCFCNKNIRLDRCFWDYKNFGLYSRQLFCHRGCEKPNMANNDKRFQSELTYIKKNIKLPIAKDKKDDYTTKKIYTSHDMEKALAPYINKNNYYEEEIANEMTHTTTDTTGDWNDYIERQGK